MLWHAFLFLGLRFFLPFFLFLAWWPPLLFLLRNYWESLYLLKTLASKRRKVSLDVHGAHADNVLRGLSAAEDGVEAASFSARVPSSATALFTRDMGRKRPRASSSGA